MKMIIALIMIISPLSAPALGSFSVEEGMRAILNDKKLISEIGSAIELQKKKAPELTRIAYDGADFPDVDFPFTKRYYELTWNLIGSCSVTITVSQESGGPIQVESPEPSAVSCAAISQSH